MASGPETWRKRNAYENFGFLDRLGGMTAEVLLPTLPSLLIARNSPFIHRDLSWLQFNEKVLAEARLASNPLLERVKFLAISASNLDEFFMIRFSSLGRSILAARRQDGKLERRLLRIRANILEAVAKFELRQGETLDILSSELSVAGIHLVRRPAIDSPAFQYGKKLFVEQILPSLSAPEGYTVSQLQNLENLQLAAIMEPNLWFKIPRSLPSIFFYNHDTGTELFVFFLDDLLYTHLGAAFNLPFNPGIFRLTRDADFSLDFAMGDTESIPDAIRSNVRVRDKAKPVRLQWVGQVPQAILQRASHFFKFVPGQILSSPATLGLSGLWALYHYPSQDLSPRKQILKYPELKAYIPKPFLQPQEIFAKVKTQDFLLHHPYDSFDTFVRWVKAACEDPEVEMIEQTLYRVDALSEVVDALKIAAKKKMVRVVIELRARFDELNNLKLAEDLRSAGVQVAFGFGKLKLHAKVALVTRRETDGTKLYTHLSTGNYNAMTARQYTDLAILTSNPEIGADARKFFDSIWAGKVPTGFKQLVSAPTQLHRKLLSLIQAETEAARLGRKARIVAKVNALVDEDLIRNLYEASQAGVQVDLIVRGATSIIPGVKGLSENIRVISIVDRFLEHSRLYYFGDSKALYLSSADWMPRNFFSRLELAFPVLDARIYKYIEQIVIPAYLLDTLKARELAPQGVWRRRTASGVRVEELAVSSPQNQKSFGAQRFFEELAVNSYQNTILSESLVQIPAKNDGASFEDLKESS